MATSGGLLGEPEHISGLANPGEILVSRTVVNLTAGSGLQFDAGVDHQLKGVPGTWPTVAAVASN